MYRICFTLILLLNSIPASAQYIDREPTLEGILQPRLDSSLSDNLQLNHTFAVSAASGGAGFSTQSLYLSHLTWQLATPLQLKLDLGLARTTLPTGLRSQENPRLIGGGELSWRPTDNTLFRISLYHGPFQRAGWRQTPGIMPYDYPTQ
nr:hypothetical protein [bacterium]